VNRATPLHATEDLEVVRFDHPAHERHDDPEREVASHWGIAFVSAGRFDVLVGGHRHRLRQGGVFLTRPGLEFRCEHGEACPDDVSLSVRLEEVAVRGLEEAWTRIGWVARPSPSPRLAYVQRRMAAASGQGDTFEIERWALAAIGALDVDSRRAPSRGHYVSRHAGIEMVVATCRAIDDAPTAQRSIADRARAVGTTGTRLTHAFRRYVGVSPHQYVVRRRLAAAAALLDQGSTVSDACWRSGFGNLSHFCRSFIRAFGKPASQWRHAPLAERRRKVQAFLGPRP